MIFILVVNLVLVILIVTRLAFSIFYSLFNIIYVNFNWADLKFEINTIILIALVIRGDYNNLQSLVFFFFTAAVASLKVYIVNTDALSFIKILNYKLLYFIFIFLMFSSYNISLIFLTLFLRL